MPLAHLYQPEKEKSIRHAHIHMNLHKLESYHDSWYDSTWNYDESKKRLVIKITKCDAYIKIGVLPN